MDGIQNPKGCISIFQSREAWIEHYNITVISLRLKFVRTPFAALQLPNT